MVKELWQCVKPFSPNTGTSRTDRRTDRIAISISCGRVLTRDKNQRIFSTNKCIGDDTKAAARQSPNCIIKTKNRIWRKTIFNMADRILTPCNVTRSWRWFRQVHIAWCTVWHVALGSWQWIHQVAVGLYPATWHVALQEWHFIEFVRWQHPAMWHVALA